MDLLPHYYLILSISVQFNPLVADYMIRVTEFTFMPIDRDLIISQSSSIEQEGNRSYLSGHLLLSRSVKEVQMVVTMDIARPKKQRIRLFEKKLEVCSFFRNDYRSKFLQQIHTNYMKFINEAPACPLRAHFNYTLKRAYVDDRFLPELLPECSYFLNLDFIYQGKRVSHLTFSGQLKPISGLKFPKVNAKS